MRAVVFKEHGDPSVLPVAHHVDWTNGRAVRALETRSIFGKVIVKP